MPGSSERSGFRLAVANHGGNDQLGIVEGGAASVRKDVAEFATFMNRSRGLGRAVAADPAREGELPEELAQPIGIETLFRVGLRVRALEIRRAKNAGCAVPGAGEKNHVEIVFLNQPIQMHVDEGESGAGSPVTEQAGS